LKEEQNKKIEDFKINKLYFIEKIKMKIKFLMMNYYLINKLKKN